MRAATGDEIIIMVATKTHVALQLAGAVPVWVDGLHDVMTDVFNDIHNKNVVRQVKK